MVIVQYKVLLNKETGRTYLKEGRTINVDEKYKYVNSPQMVYEFADEVLDITSQAEERFYMFAINAKSKIIGIFKVSHGTVGASLASPREVFLRAFLIGATRIIIVHNHPSQDYTPSEDDKRVTSRMKEVGSLVGIPLADHIIVGDGYYSFRQAGLL